MTNKRMSTAQKVIQRPDVERNKRKRVQLESKMKGRRE